MTDPTISPHAIPDVKEIIIESCRCDEHCKELTGADVYCGCEHDAIKIDAIYAAREGISAARIRELEAEVERLRTLDREAGQHIEATICLRTKFTGEPPYVGWKGLGLALNEALDERDALRAENKKLREFVAWVDAWVSNPATSYSVSAIDGLFGMTRDRLAALNSTGTALATAALTAGKGD